MNRPLHVLRRKVKTLSLTIAKCSDWFLLVLAKSGLNDAVDTLRFRDGFQLKAIRPLRHTWGEIFEAAIADVYEITRHAPDLVIDVGANIGAFACRAAFLHRRAIVHAFEPSAAHAAVLRKNIALNRLENVIIHDYPVTKDGREVEFSRIGSGGSSGIFLQDNRDSAVLLKSVTLDRINFADFGSSFIKLDCEGAEGEIIEWICANLVKLPPQIIIACEYHHWCPVPRDQILGNLKGHGFAAEEKSLFDESYIFAWLDRGIRIRKE